MITGFWGKKIGMTQVYAEDKVIPVTAIDVGNWMVVGFKAEEKDGYNAVKIGCLRHKYQDIPFSSEWLKKIKDYFSFIREIRLDKVDCDNLKCGQPVMFHEGFTAGDVIDLAGKTKGRGFTGVIKRHGFSGGKSSHGSKIHRATGSIGFMRTRGRVIKGKKLAGQMGNEKMTIKNIPIVMIDKESKVVLIKGSIPGMAGSFVFIHRQGL